MNVMEAKMNDDMFRWFFFDNKPDIVNPPYR